MNLNYLPKIRRKWFNNHLCQRNISEVVMIRHGESTWNLEKRFTGWCDVPLTKHGEADARDAGSLIQKRGLKFDIAFTSNLERAWRTCETVLAESGQSNIETVRTWKLNERHYGGMYIHVLNETHKFHFLISISFTRSFKE